MLCKARNIHDLSDSVSCEGFYKEIMNLQVYDINIYGKDFDEDRILRTDYTLYTLNIYKKIN
jgi:hypothetical protein